MLLPASGRILILILVPAWIGMLCTLKVGAVTRWVGASLLVVRTRLCGRLGIVFARPFRVFSAVRCPSFVEREFTVFGSLSDFFPVPLVVERESHVAQLFLLPPPFVC